MKEPLQMIEPTGQRRIQDFQTNDACPNEAIFPKHKNAFQ